MGELSDGVAETCQRPIVSLPSAGVRHHHGDNRMLQKIIIALSLSLPAGKGPAHMLRLSPREPVESEIGSLPPANATRRIISRLDPAHSTVPARPRRQHRAEHWRAGWRLPRLAGPNLRPLFRRHRRRVAAIGELRGLHDTHPPRVRHDLAARRSFGEGGARSVQRFCKGGAQLISARRLVAEGQGRGASGDKAPECSERGDVPSKVLVYHVDCKKDVDHFSLYSWSCETSHSSRGLSIDVQLAVSSRRILASSRSFERRLSATAQFGNDQTCTSHIRFCIPGIAAWSCLLAT